MIPDWNNRQPAAGRLVQMGYRARLLRWAPLGLLGWLSWRSINYFSGIEPGPDSSIFMSIATHLNAGQALYRDVGDIKPPVVFLLNSLALAIGGDGVNSVRMMERIFAVLGALAFSGVAYLAFRKWWLAYLAGVPFLLHFYSLHVVEHGNVTEEYGSVLSLAGMFAALGSVQGPPRLVLPLATLSGISFSAAILTKEPFLLIGLPWFIYLAWAHNGDWKFARRRATFSLIGVTIPALLFLSYLLYHGTVSDWLETIYYTVFVYTAGGPSQPKGEHLKTLFAMADQHVFGLMLITRISALLGLLHAIWWILTRQTFGPPVAIAAAVVAGLLATSLGGRYFGHYYLFLVPSYILLGVSGIALITGVRQRGAHALAVAALLAILVADIPPLHAYVRQVAQPYIKWPGHVLSSLIRNNTAPEDRIWTPWKPLLYAESGRLSPTKWLFNFDPFLDTPTSTASEKYAALRRDLERQPPKLIVLNAPPGRERTRATADAFLARAGLTPWVASNYRTLIGSAQEPFEVLVAKDPRGGVPDGRE